MVKGESILIGPLPGELYWAYIESEHRRPIIIVSRQKLNLGKYVVAVPLTSKNLEKRWNLPNYVSFKKGSFGLQKDCVAQCEAITVVDKDFIELNTGPIGILDGEKWRSLLHAIGYVVCAVCEPEQIR
jgi:mRNA-degrading endonuclease toxin of MazEF toxin-antitoxin module